MKVIFRIMIVTIVLFSTATVYGDVYDAFKSMGISASNYLIKNLETGFATEDYELFSVCAERIFELGIDEAMPVFNDVFSEASIDYYSSQPDVVAGMREYLYITILAYGHFGDDSDAHTLYSLLYRHQDDYTTYYVIQALGLMTNSSVALDYLHSSTDWVDSFMLATVLVDSIVAHDNMESITYLKELSMNSSISGMKSYINDAIATLTESALGGSD